MEITKQKLKQIIKEELKTVLNETGLPTRYADPAAVKTMAGYNYGKLPPEEEEGGAMYDRNLFGDEGREPDTTSKIHSNPKLAGEPASWLRMSDTLKQMSRVWSDPEDGKMLELAGAILRSAFEQHSAESDAALDI